MRIYTLATRTLVSRSYLWRATKRSVMANYGPAYGTLASNQVKVIERATPSCHWYWYFRLPWNEILNLIKKCKNGLNPFLANLFPIVLTTMLWRMEWSCASRTLILHRLLLRFLSLPMTLDWWTSSNQIPFRSFTEMVVDFDHEKTFLSFVRDNRMIIVLNIGNDLYLSRKCGSGVWCERFAIVSNGWSLRKTKHGSSHRLSPCISPSCKKHIDKKKENLDQWKWFSLQAEKKNFNGPLFQRKAPESRPLEISQEKLFARKSLTGLLDEGLRMFANRSSWILIQWTSSEEMDWFESLCRIRVNMIQ